MSTEINSPLSNLIVYYGFARLTKKAVRKRSIAIYYSNTKLYNNERQQKFIKQKIHIVYERFQTEEEATDAPFSNRSWTKWEYFVDDKRWRGNLNAILDDNFTAEENHITVEEREKIRNTLLKNFEPFYKQYEVTMKR
jgi:hypothetical protein